MSSLGGLDLTAGNAGFKANDLMASGIQIANVALSFLAVVFLVLMIAGGFMWMTAAGEDAKVKTARALIGAAVIGIIIVFVAFVLTSFFSSSFTV